MLFQLSRNTINNNKITPHFTQPAMSQQIFLKHHTLVEVCIFLPLFILYCLSWESLCTIVFRWINKVVLNFQLKLSCLKTADALVLGKFLITQDRRLFPVSSEAKLHLLVWLWSAYFTLWKLMRIKLHFKHFSYIFKDI